MDVCPTVVFTTRVSPTRTSLKKRWPRLSHACLKSSPLGNFAKSSPPSSLRRANLKRSPSPPSLLSYEYSYVILTHNDYRSTLPPPSGTAQSHSGRYQKSHR